MAPLLPKKRRLSLDDTSPPVYRKAPNTSRIPPHNGLNTGPTMLSSGAYSSSVLQLQVDELLSKIRPNYERHMGRVNKVIRKLKGIIERIPNREARSVQELERDRYRIHHTRIPFPNPLPEKEARYTLAYAKPTNIIEVGSYAQRTAIQVGDQTIIDLAVIMPNVVFREKDYLNYRYFHQRAYYLACIASGIEEDEESTLQLQFALQNDNELQPVIIVKPGHGEDDFRKSRCGIRIILAADGDLFPKTKTLPDKNCVRPNDGSTSQGYLSTPFYNASIRSECSSLACSRYLKVALEESDGFADACTLGSVWLRQRGLGRGGFGAFEWAYTIALLMQHGGLKGKPLLSKGYSSYQLFKATLQYLAVKDLASNPVLIESEGIQIAKTDHPVLFDGASGLNILFKMTPWSYATLRHEASHSLQSLSDPLSDQFDSCFITNIDDSLSRFDCIIRLPTSNVPSSPIGSLDSISKSVARCHRLYQVLKRGLGDRVRLLHLEIPPTAPWALGSQAQNEVSNETVQVGFLLDPENVYRTVDRGPSAEDKDGAAEFRKFWGERAELRRFKDGSIQESLIWSPMDAEGSVLEQIITYVIRRHGGEGSAVNMKIAGKSFHQLLPAYMGAGSDNVTGYQPIKSAFELLEKEVRGLEGLPLQIRQITAADPQLRYASVKVPFLDSTHCSMEPANICVQFEGSSRWPDDLSAIQKTKIAFLLKIGELLEAMTPGIIARLSLENQDRYLLNAAFLDISYPSGAFFRLRIHHERELDLLERTLKGGTHTTASREEIAFAVSTYKRDFMQAPLHTQAVSTLCTRFPLLSPSMRLMKKWRDTHLLSGHVSEELIELLTIRTFLHPYPWSVPGSIMTGFLRTLTFLSKWDWRSEPLIVDFNGVMASQELDAIRLRFEAWRKVDPAMNHVAMFAASNIEREGIAWTETGPSKVAAARLTGLAKAACVLVKEYRVDIEPEVLSTPALGDFDFVIHLNPNFVGGRSEVETGAQPIFKNLQVQALEDKSLVGFNATQTYVQELRILYGNNVLFFHNAQGGSIITGLWNPQTGPRPWKLNLQYSTIPNPTSKHEEGEAQVNINKTAVLNDIGRLGGDMVLRIVANRHHGDG